MLGPETSKTTAALALATAIASIALPRGGAHAAERPLKSLFPFEASVTISSDARPIRMTLPLEILDHCEPDLADVRLFDDRDREVPHLLEDRGLFEAAYALGQDVPLEVAEVHREEVRGESHPPRHRERLVVGPPRGVEIGRGPWTLVAGLPAGELVRDVVVRRAADGQELARGTWFRLRSGAARTTLALDGWRGGPLEVIIEGEGAGPIGPTLTVRSRREIPGRSRERIALDVVDRHVADRATRLEVARPPGTVLPTLVLETSTPTFDRAVDVFDVDPRGEARRVGTGRVFRLRGAVSFDHREIDVASLRGDRLRLVIHDLDSPPLEDLRVDATGYRPAIVFDLPDGARAATLRFGGGRVGRPRYDVENLRPRSGLAGGRALAAARLVAGEGFGVATVGPVRTNPRFDETPPLAFAMRPGAELDVRRWRKARRLEVPASPEGVVRIALAAEDLSAARPDLGDLRVVDAGGRQWPYLLERSGRRDRAELGVAPPRREDDASRWTFALPVTPLPILGLELDVAAPFFDRAVVVVGDDGSGERVLTSTRLVRRVEDDGPVRIAIPTTRVERLELRVIDGDDAPLDVRVAHAVVPAATVRLVAPPGSYALLVGDPFADPPTYELARVRDVVLAVRAVEARPGPLLPHVAFARVARWRDEVAPGAWLAWLAVGGAVLVLGAMTARLAREVGGAPDDPGDAPPRA